MQNQSGQVIVNNDPSPPFPINNGGKQGDPLFPLLYVIAIEGLTALLKQSPEYTGIHTPDQSAIIRSVGFADDTVIGIGSMQDADALPNILKTFEQASGNQIKPAKSYIMWLGSWRRSRRTIYGIKPLPIQAHERYLGIMIQQKLNLATNWGTTIEGMQRSIQHWRSFNLSIFGRTLMINSCLVSKLWFKAHHLPISNKYLSSI